MTSHLPERDLVWAERPAGTRLSRSSTTNAMSALVFNDHGELVTHAELHPADDHARQERAQGLTAGLAVGLVVGAALTFAAVKAAPHAKNRLDSLKTKLNRHTTTAPEDIAVESGEATPGSETDTNARLRLVPPAAA